MDNKNFKIVEVDSIEEIGQFDDEWVYDLEMEDESHTFIANDILVHNTDSIFVGFQPAVDSCEWKNMLFNEETLSKISNKFLVISNSIDFSVNNPNLKEIINVGEEGFDDELKSKIQSSIEGCDIVLIDGEWVKDYTLNDILSEYSGKVFYNWASELQFIHGMDKFRIEGYFKDELDKHAESYGVENVQDFELERISESIINIAKKKYIQHILFEDGVSYDPFDYIYPKGVELVRSSTPAFAREKIVDIVKYLFSHPDTFNIKDLLKLVKNLRKEFELADIDDICLQSSVSNYDQKVINDKVLPLQTVSGAHFAVKASAYYNYLLQQQNNDIKQRYEPLKSGTKIKYFVCKDKRHNAMFAYIRGSYPMEFAPEIDYDEQFAKSILSPINSIIEPLGMPQITKRLSVVMDIFS